MKKQISLNLSGKAFDRLSKLSKLLGLTRDELASLCLEYVDVKHQGIVAAATKMKRRNKKKRIHKKDLSQHLNELSAEQVELLLSKADKKKKS